MAAKKLSPAARQVADDVIARLEAQPSPPEGAAAGLNLAKVDFKKLIPAVVSGLIEAAGIAQDGHLSPTEAVRVAELVFGLITRLRRESSPAI